MSDNHSDNYIVSARKYRPSTFHSVVGQPGLVSTLRNAITTGRIGQAYLFCGPRGVGKTSCARIFARAVNCMNPTPEGEACGECESCKAIDRGNSYNLVELDAASNNSVEDIRTLIEQVTVPPQIGKYRLFIIDEVHMLSSQAFNAFLKTLEEPPSYAIFVLATTEKHKVIPTILSRCQIYDFKRITIDDIVKQLQYVASQEGYDADPRALGVIARKADGAMRDALSIFDQVAASTHGHLTYEGVTENLNVLDYEFFFRLIDSFRRGDVPDSLLIYKDIRDRGFDSLFFVNSLMQHVRDLMVAADKRTLPLLEVPADVAERLAAQAGELPLQWYYKAMELLNDCDYNYRISSSKQLLVELTLIRLCQLLAPATPPFDSPRRPELKTPGRTVQQEQTEPSTPQPSTPQPSAPQSPSAASQPAPPSPAPQPVPASNPGKQAGAAPQPASRPARRPVRQTIRLNADMDTEAVARVNDEAFTDERFMEVWNQYIIRHPEHSILVSAMRAVRPERLGATEYRVFVQNPSQMAAYNMESRKFVEFFRNELHNDNVEIRFEIDPTQAAVPKMMPAQEFLRKAISANPALGEFLKSVDAELS